MDSESAYIVDANGNQIHIGDKVILTIKGQFPKGFVCNGIRFEKGQNPRVLVNSKWFDSCYVTAASALGSVERALLDSLPSGTSVGEVKQLAALVKALAIEERSICEPMLGELANNSTPSYPEDAPEASGGDA